MTILHCVDFFPTGKAPVAIEPRLPQPAFPEHHHDFHEIVVVEHGTGIHVFNGQPYTISGGTVCFVRDHDRHLYEHTDNLCLTNVLYRSPDAFQFLAGLNQLLPHDARLNLLMAWLEDNFADEVCWEALAEKFSLSLRTLHRQLKQQTGLTPQRYLNRLRLIKARHLLRHSDDSVTDIAYLCGFGDSNHFSTLFRREFKWSPRDIRQGRDLVVASSLQ
ncbi:MAG: HTH-type transcriptional activator RhaS [Citrobacter freundii]|nr:HTH-type transcriptional activator RhaS [Citrobacter freundii]